MTIDSIDYFPLSCGEIFLDEWLSNSCFVRRLISSFEYFFGFPAFIFPKATAAAFFIFASIPRTLCYTIGLVKPLDLLPTGRLRFKPSMPGTPFTTENARSMFEKGLAVRRAQAAESKRIADAWSPQEPEPATQEKQPEHEQKSSITPTFIVKDLKNKPQAYEKVRLKRVRKQLNKLDQIVWDELNEKDEKGKNIADGQRLNWLGQFQDRLSEQERVLDGRPNPGSVRPTIKSMKDREQRGPTVPTAPPQAEVKPVEHSVEQSDEKHVEHSPENPAGE